MSKTLIGRYGDVVINRRQYEQYAQDCVSSISRKHKIYKMCYNCWVIESVTFDYLKKICKLFGCSGFMSNDSTAVVCNFGYYK